MNLPNFLSLMRMCLVPVFVAVFFSPSPYAHIHAALIYAISGITDIADGFIARKFNLITKLGKILDPLADKLMTITVFVCISIAKIIPWWVITLLFTKDFLLVLGGVKLYNEMASVFQSNFFGKLATVFLVLGGISVLLFENIISYAFKTVFAYISITLSFLAFFSYLRQYVNFRKMHDVSSFQKKDW